MTISLCCRWETGPPGPQRLAQSPPPAVPAPFLPGLSHHPGEGWAGTGRFSPPCHKRGAVLVSPRSGLILFLECDPVHQGHTMSSKNLTPKSKGPCPPGQHQ